MDKLERSRVQTREAVQSITIAQSLHTKLVFMTRRKLLFKKKEQEVLLNFAKMHVWND